MDQKFCGLFRAHVNVSEYNHDGNCACLSCAGQSCQSCPTFDALRSEFFTAVEQKIHIRCVACKCRHSQRKR